MKVKSGSQHYGISFKIFVLILKKLTGQFDLNSNMPLLFKDNKKGLDFTLSLCIYMVGPVGLEPTTSRL
ncbi:MAG: hypothetical protein RLZZ66_357 [Pseudomonadota bacterium]